MRMPGKEGWIIHPCKRDLRAIELCGEQRLRRCREYSRNPRVRLSAPFNARDIGRKKRIVSECLVLEHLLREHAPFTIALNGYENVGAVFRFENTALRILPEGIANGRDPDDVGIGRMNHDRADLPGVFESNKRPFLARVG